MTFDLFDPETGTRLVSLARETVARVARGDDIDGLVERYDDLPDVDAGAFVTVKRGDRLRGCIGRVEATQPVAHAVKAGAADAARNDPRTRPVEPDELSDITVTVTILSEPTEVIGDLPETVEVGRDGLIVSRGAKRGLLLPQVATEHGWSAEQFLAETCRKAGLPRDAWRQDGVTVERFTARTFEQQEPQGAIEVTRYDGVDESSDEPAHETVSRGPADGDPVTDGGRSETAVRPPSVAGQFYAGDEHGLGDQIESAIADDQGPGSVDALSESERVPHTLVSPHAGYPYSGPIAAHGYAALAAGPTPDTVVILGPNHEGVGAQAAVPSHTAWQTPLGTVPIDEEFRDRLVDESDLTVDDRAHRREHSLEVQIPFLQYLLDSVSVVPVCLKRIGKERAEQLGRELASVAEDVDGTVTVVSSTDLTHHVPHEQAVAADERIREAVRDLDTDAIAAAVGDGHSMCGPWATVAGLTFAAERGATAAKLLAYATSGETAGSKSRVVGYCSAIA